MATVIRAVPLNLTLSILSRRYFSFKNISSLMSFFQFPGRLLLPLLLHIARSCGSWLIITIFFRRVAIVASCFVFLFLEFFFSFRFVKLPRETERISVIESAFLSPILFTVLVSSTRRDKFSFYNCDFWIELGKVIKLSRLIFYRVGW